MDSNAPQNDDIQEKRENQTNQVFEQDDLELELARDLGCWSSPNITRSVGPVESCFRQSQEFSAATGLPKDLDEIFSPAHAQEEEVRKTLADVMSFKELDFEESPSTMQPSLRGARMLPLATMFAKDLNEDRTSKNNDVDYAPPLPSFHKPLSTSYRTNESLTTIRKDLETAFRDISVYFEQEEAPSSYDCSVVCQGTQVEFEVNIYLTPEQEHLVDIERMRGDRSAFNELVSNLAAHLRLCSSISVLPGSPKSSWEPLAPPPASLEFSTDLPVSTPCESAASSSPADATNTKASKESASFAKHFLSMLSKNSRLEVKLQTVRAVGVLATLAHNGDVESALFTDKRWGQVVERVAHLATDAKAARNAPTPEMVDNLQVVSMAALANVVKLQSNWLSAALHEYTIDTALAGVQNEFNHHLRREALRATVDLSASRDAAARFVRGGIIPHLERLSEGPDEGDCADALMQSFAQATLVSCRA